MRRDRKPVARACVALTGRRQAVETTLDTAHGDDVQVLCAAVVAAVHDRGHGKTESHAVLVPLGTSATCYERERGATWQ